MNKKLLLISISSILTLALLIFFMVMNWDFFVGDVEKTCSEQNGNICSSSQTCSGSWLDASDSERCCSGGCGEYDSLQINLIDQINLGDNVARPELIATEDRIFVIYMDTLNHSFQVIIYSKDFDSKIAKKVLVSMDSQYGIATDIRVDSDGEYLYAFYEMANIQTETTSLFGRKYRLNDDFDLIAETGLIRTSIVFTKAQKGDELLDDPIVLVTENEVLAITRYKNNFKISDETIYKIYKFTKDLVKIEEFDLDISSVADGGPRQASVEKVKNYYYMVLPTTVGTVSPNTPEIDNTAPADLLEIKIDENWNIIDSKKISADENAVETYVTGFDFDGEFFYVGYKHIPQPISTMTGMLKIYDKEFSLVIEEEVKTNSQKLDQEENTRMSLDIYNEKIYYVLDNEVFVYEKSE